MTTSVSGWPKLSHQHFRWALGLLLLSGGILVAIDRAGAREQSRDPFLGATATDNSRAAVRRSVTQEIPGDVAAPAEPTRGPHHKTWKEVARARNEEKTRDPSSPSLSPWTAVMALAVVVCLILVLARLFRRHAPMFSQSLPTEALEVLGRRFLDQRQSVVLLRIGSRILVVGSSAAGLQGIGELNDPIEVDLIAGMCRGTKQSRGMGTSFLTLLKGQATQTNTRPRNESPRRPEPRTPEPRMPDEEPPSRMADPQHELMRRLRAASSPGTAHTGSGEVYRG